MKKITAGLAIVVSISLQAQQVAVNASSDSAPKVKTTSGIVWGVNEGDVDSFKGIPYAAPPVGEFRWRPPQRVAAWQGERDAGKFASSCAQGGWGAAPGKIQDGSSEDCPKPEPVQLLLE